jgi:hypothetical protein
LSRIINGNKIAAKIQSISNAVPRNALAIIDPNSPEKTKERSGKHNESEKQSGSEGGALRSRSPPSS